MRPDDVYRALLDACGGREGRNGEIHVDCPMCGKPAKLGHTHFSFRYDHATGVGGGHCFVCGGNINLYDLARHYGIDVGAPDSLDVQERRLRRIEAEQARQAAAQREMEARLAALEQMHRCQDHLRYHHQMKEAQRAYWYSEGIFDEAISRHLLGYCPSCPTYRESASYTIPVFGYNGELMNIRHRLINPAANGKYRPHIAGLGAQLFGADILAQDNERVLVLEGEKKAIVYQQHGWPAVGLMGKSFRWRAEWFDWFRSVGEIIIALDPDAEEAAWRLAALFVDAGFRQVRVANFPVKPDDYIVRWGATKSQVEAVLKAAWRAKSNKNH